MRTLLLFNQIKIDLCGKERSVLVTNDFFFLSFPSSPVVKEIRIAFVVAVSLMKN